MLSLKNNSRGMASLLTVVFISIILSIIVLGFIRVAINEQRQAADDDLSTRAFYAAESGIEDAKRAVIQELTDVDNSFNLYGDECRLPVDSSPSPSDAAYSGVISSSDEFDVEYTCMLVDLTPADYQTVLEPGESVNILLVGSDGSGGATLPSGLTVEWHLTDSTNGDGDYERRSENSVDLPPVIAWDNGGTPYPAMLRAYLYSYPNAGAFDSDDLNNSTTLIFANPSSTPDTNGWDFSITSGGAGNLGISDTPCVDPTSSPLEEYACNFTVNMSSSDVTTLRLTSLYRPTHVKVTLQRGNGSIMPFIDGQQVLVDVTGRAADVFRRIEARIDLDKSLEDLLPDYAIFSADDICKNFGINDTTFNQPNCRP